MYSVKKCPSLQKGNIPSTKHLLFSEISYCESRFTYNTMTQTSENIVEVIM